MTGISAQNRHFQIQRNPKEFPDAFILSALEHYHKEHKANIAVVSEDGDFRKACALRRFIENFSKLDEYIKAFEPELKSEDLERPVNAPTQTNHNRRPY